MNDCSMEWEEEKERGSICGMEIGWDEHIYIRSETRIFALY